MTGIDVIILLLVAAGLVVGYIQGMISQVTTLCAVVIGIVACNVAGAWAVEVFKSLVPGSAEWSGDGLTVSVVAHIVLFVVVFLAVLIAGHVIKGAVKTLHLGFIDKLLGSVVCVAKYLLAMSIVLNLWLAVSPGSEIFSTQHAADNVPFEIVLDAAPAVLGMSQMPSRTIHEN